MAQKNKATFSSDYDTIFATNTNRDISEADVRAFKDDIKDSALFFLDDLLDEDDFVSDSETKVPSQQSTKAYIASQLQGINYSAEITTGSGGAPATVLTIPIATGRTVAIHAQINSEWVSGGPGAGSAGHIFKIGSYKNISGTVSLIGSVSTVHSATTDASVPTLSLTISGTDVLITATPASGVVYDVLGKATVITK